MDICAANNQFAIDALRQLSGASEAQNIVLSPMSLLTVFGVIYLGAMGNTAAQIGKTLHFDSVKDVHFGCKNLLSTMKKNGNGQVVIIANKLFGEKTFDFLPAFLEDAMKLYGAGLEQLDFYNDPEKSRQYINNWVSQQTNGKIKEMLPEQSITSSTSLVATNSLYFAANWTNQFSERRTYKSSFTLLSNEKVTVDMMTTINTFKVKHIKRPGLKVIDLPYGPLQDFSMMMIIPDNNVILKQAIRGISLEKLNAWLKTTDEDMQHVAVHLPKFKTEKSFSLKKMFNSLGITDAFSQVKANFSGMTEHGNMFMSDVYHQTSLEVNEKGTEAASSAGVVMTLRSIPSDEIKVDRPFCYAVRDNKSNCILLFGVMYNP